MYLCEATGEARVSKMRKTLFEISQEHNIPPNTLRVAIHRKLLDAAKVGHIRMIDDESENFKTYLAQYNARSAGSSSSKREPANATGDSNSNASSKELSRGKEIGNGLSNSEL